MLENDYQRKLVKRIKKRLPGCIVLKNDSGYLQGIPDLTILHGSKWAVLEVKRSPDADQQPNQDWYIETFNGMSYASFIFPENEGTVLDELQQTLTANGNARVPKRK